MDETVSLTVDNVTRVAKEAARLTSPELQVMGVTLGGGAASDYIEILVNVTGGRETPSQIEIGAFRDVPESTLLEEIERKLREYLTTRRPVE
jgi:hypothetical protein